jgi:hypothetical protein
MTVAELMETLSGFNPDSEVRLASQPKWPFEYSISEVIAAVSDDADSDSDTRDLEIVYIAEGTQIDYLNGDAIAQLGWL